MSNTPLRHIRVADELWQSAMAKAKSQNRKLSELIRGWLQDYVHEGEK